MSIASFAAAEATAAPSARANAPLPHNNDRPLGFLQLGQKLVLAASELCKTVRPGTDVLKLVTQIDVFANHADGELAGPPAFPDTSVENGGLEARVGSDDQERIGFFKFPRRWD